MRLTNRLTPSSILRYAKGGGGGGGSGKVDYPQYLKDSHAELLYGNSSNNQSDMSITVPMDVAVNNAITGDPYLDMTPFDPTPHIMEMANAIDDLDVFINSMNSVDEIDVQLAQFDAGMRDINAVVSSSFGIGRQIVAAGLIGAKLDAKKHLAQLSIESRRLMIVANSEYVEKANEYEVKHEQWTLEMLQKGGNVLASIAGAATTSAGSEPNRTQSAIGGALSGAAAGAMVGGPVGAGIGGAIGLAAGLF